MNLQSSRHPTYNLTYNSFKFTVSQPSIGWVSIGFEDLREGCEYLTVQQLKNISFKTIITALKETEPVIIKATLIPLAHQQYQLRIKVSLQYINDVEEVFLLQGRKMDEERIKQVKSLNRMAQTFNQMKQEMVNVCKGHYLGGIVTNKPSKLHQIFLNIPYQTTIFSMNLSFNAVENPVMKVSFSYVDSVTNQILPHNLLPDQMYLTNSSELSVVVNKNSFSRAVFRIQGDFDRFDYNIKAEQVHYSTPFNYKKVVVTVASMIFLIGLLYLSNTLLQQLLGLFGSSQEET